MERAEGGYVPKDSDCGRLEDIGMFVPHGTKAFQSISDIQVRSLRLENLQLQNILDLLLIKLTESKCR